MKRFIGIMAASAGLMLFSCENSLSVVQELTREDTIADVTARDISFIRSDSGMVQMTLNAARMNRFSLDDPAVEFPEGFEAFFYDSLKTVTSRIRADYGISYEKTRLIIAKNNVEVENFETGETLKTESLFWDQQKRIIFTKDPVQIESPDKVVFGDSMTASEGFDRRTIYNVRATIEVEDDEGSTD
jgi:LPS export ABC transporter protein LptC